MTTPNINEVWVSADSTEFLVEQIEEKDNQVWIYYSHGAKKYNCLIDAFTSRFHKKPQ